MASDNCSRLVEYKQIPVVGPVNGIRKLLKTHKLQAHIMDRSMAADNYSVLAKPKHICMNRPINGIE